jgi:hypothetical protein
MEGIRGECSRNHAENTTNFQSASVAESYDEIQVTSAATTEIYTIHLGPAPGSVQGPSWPAPSGHGAWPQKRRQQAD